MRGLKDIFRVVCVELQNRYSFCDVGVQGVADRLFTKQRCEGAEVGLATYGKAPLQQLHFNPATININSLECHQQVANLCLNVNALVSILLPVVHVSQVQSLPHDSLRGNILCVATYYERDHESLRRVVTFAELL